MTVDAWLSSAAPLAHAVGYAGFALILLSMVYSLRKRKLLLRGGRMSSWLWMHHLAGLIGGLLALGHTLGNLRGLGLWLAVLLVMCITSSAVSLVEARVKAPQRRANEQLARRRVDRDRLDAGYRELLAKGTAWTYEGHDLYARLMATIEAVKEAEVEAGRLEDASPKLHWWWHVHVGSTAMMFGVLAVHIWSKVYLSGVAL
jgi:cell division protein FtsL